MGTAVLEAAREEATTLVTDTQSTPENVEFAPQAWTREGRSD
jgi:hypothetical protein